MIFCRENRDDIRKYFSGSYIKFPEAGDDIHYVERVDPDAIRGKVYTMQENGKYDTEPYMYMLNPKSQTSPDVTFIMPKKSYFNHNGRAFQLYRVPARQYHKGITAENTAIQWLTGEGKVEGIHIDYVILQAYVGKQKFLNFAERDLVSYAVSPRMAVAKNGSIFLDEVKVANINYKLQTIYCHDSLIMPDIKKVLADHGQVIYSVIDGKEKKVMKKEAANA